MRKPAGASAYNPVPLAPGVTPQQVAPGVVIYRGVPLCPWDGSIMPFNTFAVWSSIWECPSPGYEFECEICGWEDEIS